MAGGLAEKISKWVLTNGGESGNIRLVREAGALCAGSEYGGIAQLGAQVTSKTTPNLSKKSARFPLGIFRNLFYNQQSLIENQRFHAGKVAG